MIAWLKSRGSRRCFVPTYSFAGICSLHRLGYSARDDSQHGGATIVLIDHCGVLQFGRGSANEVVSAHLLGCFSYKDSLSAVYDRTQGYGPLMWGLISLCWLTALIYAVLVRPISRSSSQPASMSIK